jgi:hypothetical protein
MDMNIIGEYQNLEPPESRMQDDLTITGSPQEAVKLTDSK